MPTVNVDKQVKKMEETIQDFEGRIDQIMDIIDEKMDRTAIESMISNKISMDQVIELMPNMETYDHKVQTMIDENTENLWLRLEEKLLVWDARMIQIRTEFDIVAISKSIENKANKETVANDLHNHEFKISTLDRNIVAMASDFETF